MNSSRRVFLQLTAQSNRMHKILDLCPEAERRAKLTDSAFWSEVFYPHGEPVQDPEFEPDEEVPAIGTICGVCGSNEACGYGPEGRPWIHCTQEDEG